MLSVWGHKSTKSPQGTTIGILSYKLSVHYFYHYRLAKALRKTFIIVFKECISISYVIVCEIAFLN